MTQFEVENKEIKTLLRRIAMWIADGLPKGWGFTLFLYEFAPGNSMFYICNGQREDMIKAMKEFIAKQDTQN